MCILYSPLGRSYLKQLVKHAAINVQYIHCIPLSEEGHLLTVQCGTVCFLEIIPATRLLVEPMYLRSLLLHWGDRY